MEAIPMSRSFRTTAAKVVLGVFGVLFAALTIAVQVMDVAVYGLTWQHAAKWVGGGVVAYGLYRFYRRGRDTQSAYRDRWDQLFDREASA